MFFVNGTQAINPNAPVGYGGFHAVNYFEMPEESEMIYQMCNVPHGSLHQNYYRASQSGRWKLCYVYTPPGYEQDLEKRYPVLYLQHGGGENETGWLWQGKIANIADNLLARGQMKERLIVMNAGYDFPEQSGYHHSLSAFCEELPDSGVAFIDRTYRTIADRRMRAIAGLSMGGMQTQKIAFHAPEMFAWAGIFSGGLVIKDKEDDYRQVLLNPQAFRKQFRLLFAASGTQERFYESTKKNVEEVHAHGVDVVFFEEYGYHDWTFWRKCADQFLRLLF
jgi:enterochelin esterase-like enzyme